MADDKKTAMDLLAESLRARDGIKAELAGKIERRRSLNAELFQLEEEIKRMDHAVAQHDAAAIRYMKEHIGGQLK